MTRDNHPLGKFELSGIPPAPRGVPQIEVSFEVDANGILQVGAMDKGTGKSEKITITSESGRLTEADIQRMIQEAKEHEEEDRMLREKVDSRNGLESYLYNLKNSLDGDSLESMPVESKKELEELVDETLDWMDQNPEAPKEEYDSQKKEVEQIAAPLMRDFYGRGGDDADEDFHESDL